MELDSTGLGLGVCAAGLVAAWFCLRGQATPPYKDLFDTPVATVSKLYVYPVKSCHRIEVESAECWKRGLKYDRTFAVVEKGGQFVSQRKYPTMALIQPRMDLTGEVAGTSLFLTAPGMEELEVKVPAEDCKATDSVKVWSFSGEGHYMGDEMATWFSQFLGKEGLRVYYMSPRHKPRRLQDDPRWVDMTTWKDETSYSDCAPMLIASEASMELLNSKLEEKLEVERFRPNIIVKGCSAHEEDEWPEIRIGDDVLLRNLKPCTRCKMTTVDQEKGVFSKGEPLDALFRYRFYSMVYGVNDKRFEVTPMFGCHYCIIKGGTVRIGDSIQTKRQYESKQR